MTPLEFLAAVLPAPGHGFYCAAELSTKKKEHKYDAQLENLETHITKWHDERKDVYFALSTFEEEGKRTADNARFVKSLFIDMDGYASKKEAATALKEFLEKVGLADLGSPWIVVSGGGLHCYWPFTAPVDVHTWKPVAENLKRLCKQEGLAIDMTVTADAARVLRVPGTTNFKPKYPEPRPVRIAASGDTFDFEVVAEIIRDKLTAPAYEVTKNVIELPGTRPNYSPTATSIKLFENSSTRFKNVMKATAEGRGCAQLDFYVNNAQDDGMEPLWRGLLSIAQKCDDGNKAAIWLSELHPYPAERMHAKLREIKGPYPCIKFDSENPGVCPRCPHWGKITNPLALGRELRLDTQAKEIEVTPDVPPDNEIERTVPKTIKRPPAPRGFAYGDRGGIFQEKAMEDADGGTTKKQVMLLPYDLFVVDLLHNHNEHTVHLIAMRPEGPVDITIPQKAVVSKDETVKALAQQNVIASFGKGNDNNLFDYVRACVEEASMNRKALKVPDNYGWQADNSYVYAGRVFRKGQQPIKMPMPGLDNIVSFTEPKGSLDDWRAFINLLIAKKMWKHLAIVMASAGAPLMRYTGLFGLTYHCASTESGTGKSLALEAAASVWGHPTRYRTGKSTSPVAMQQRLGLLHCHPLITDELTSRNRHDFEWFPGFLLDMTEGKGKERMEAGANKERLNLSIWATVALMSSNTHAVDYLTAGRKHASEGELRRLLEFMMEDQLSWEPHEIELIKSLQNNYGLAGYKQVEFMVENEHMLKDLVDSSVKEAYQRFDATNDERFWMAGVGTVIAVGRLWSVAGIINMPMKNILRAFEHVIKGMRKSMQAGTRRAEDVLNAYTGENYGKFIVVRRSNGSVLAELGSGQEIDQSITRSSIAGRIEHGAAEGFIDYYIEEQMLKAYCATMSFGYAAFCEQLKNDPSMIVEFLRKDMTAKTKGPQMRVAAIKIRRREGDVDGLGSSPLSLEAA